MIIHGRNMIVYAGGVAVAGARSCEIQVDADTIETTCPMDENTADGGWAKFLPGRKRWSVGCSYLVTAFKGSLMKIGQTVTLRMAVVDAGGEDVSGETLTGVAICQDVRITATIGNLCQGSFQFQGSGRLL